MTARCSNREGPRPELLVHLERTGQVALLTDEERAMLDRPEAQPLTVEEQWEWLASNRKVGFWVTACVVGVRLTLLFVGGLSVTILGFKELALGFAWVDAGLALAGLTMVAWSLSMAGRLRRRLAELRQKLPPLSEVGLDRKS